MRNPSTVPTSARYALRPAMLAVALTVAFAAPAAFAFNSGSTGADGALAPTVNTEIQLPASGILNYTSINIPAGVTVKFKKNALNTPVYILVSGNATITGAINLNGTAAAHTGTAGDGNQADDGLPGLGGPGGFDGGRGGRDDVQARVDIIRGGGGLGPGGGKGGIEGADSNCAVSGRYYPRIGGVAMHTDAVDYSNYTQGQPCGTVLTKARGAAYGSAILQPLLGGSGGGGGRGGLNYGGSGGGGGGGAILLAVTGSLSLIGTIAADGGGSGYADGVGAGYIGSGGSGGAIRLVASTLSGAGTARAIGACVEGAGTPSSNGYQYRSVYYSGTSYDNVYGSAFAVDCGSYGGGNGRVRIEADANTYTGKAYPTYSFDAPGPVFLSSLPSIRIASVAGTAVPANPTGTADVVLPTNITNPVTISLATSNVPTGNTVIVKVIPAYGDTAEAISPAISGTTASGTASVQLALPQGPSTLQAVTTYTVVVAMGEALSRFAQNERVEKVQLIATLGAEGQAKLITISGKEYLVPVSVLQMVGFAG